MVIIETDESLQSFLTRLRTDDFVFDIVLTDAKKHPCNNDVSVLFFYFLNDDSTWCFPMVHVDCILPMSTLISWYRLISEELRLSVARKFVVDKKMCNEVLGEDFGFHDLNVMNYLEVGTSVDVEDITSSSKVFIESTFREQCNLNKSIPIYHLAQMFRERVDRFDLDEIPKIDKSFEFLNNVALTRFSQLESIGMAVDVPLFLSYFGEEHSADVKNGLVFSQYNLFTSTGRPSNRFGGVNYAALNKEDGSRKSFVSRYGSDGMLVMIDYSAFHPRLISRLANYTLSLETNPYELLAKHLFGAARPSPPQIAAAKGKFFLQLYGGIRPDVMSMPYFQAVQTYIDHRWEFFTTNGYVETPIYFRKIKSCHIDNPTPNKLFNYILQAYETEVAVQTLGNILEYLKGRLTRPILYTYDSLLYDVHKSDGLGTVQSIRDIMIDGKFPVKMYAGKSYDEMSQIILK